MSVPFEKSRNLLILSVLFFWGCSAGLVKISNGIFTAEAKRSPNGFIEVTILSSSGTKLYAEEIKALASQGYSLRLSKDSLILETSDIGPVRFLKDGSGAWSGVSALDVISPDRKLIASLYRHDYQNKFVTLSFKTVMAPGRNSLDAVYEIVQEIPIDLKVSSMVDAVEWVSPEKLIIKGDVRRVIVQLQKNGRFALVDTE